MAYKNKEDARKQHIVYLNTESDFIDVKFYNDNMIITRVA